MCALATYAKALERMVVITDIHLNLGATLGELTMDCYMIQEITDEQQAIHMQLNGALGKCVEEVSKLSMLHSKLSQEVQKLEGGHNEVEEVLREAKVIAEQREMPCPEGQGQDMAMNKARWRVVGWCLSYAADVQQAVPQQHAAVMA